MEVTENNFNRLAISIMSKHQCSYESAMDKLTNLKLNLHCDDKISKSIPLQAALVTAINTGKRAFLGGVNVTLPDDCPILIPWPGKRTLNELIVYLGGSVVIKPDPNYFTLTFGMPANIDSDSLQITCNDWQGGLLTNNETSTLSNIGKIPIGGIAAGSMGVGVAFMRSSGINISAGDYSMGISLWRPDLHWLDKEASGPAVVYLPQKYWLLGLGHLGQAYLWNLGLLPYKEASKISIVLQDYDKIVEANSSAGLLCEESEIGQYKTRVCSNWLEERNFSTIISERKYDENTERCGEEPYVALCGFDSAKSRRTLEGSGFDLIVESALGGSLSSFDNIVLHTFPDSEKTPFQIWGAMEDNQEINMDVLNSFVKEKEGECGIIAETISRKSISSAFVGALSGALVIAELLRGLNGGKRYDLTVVQIRNLKDMKAFIHSRENYSTEMSRNGFVAL